MNQYEKTPTLCRADVNYIHRVLSAAEQAAQSIANLSIACKSSHGARISPLTKIPISEADILQGTMHAVITFIDNQLEHADSLAAAANDNNLTP